MQSILPPIPHMLRWYVALLPFSARNLYGIKIGVEFRNEDKVDEMAKEFPLWGLTLWMTSDLLEKAGYSPIFIRHSSTGKWFLFLMALLLSGLLIRSLVS